MQRLEQALSTNRITQKKAEKKDIGEKESKERTTLNTEPTPTTCRATLRIFLLYVNKKQYLVQINFKF